MNQKSHSNAIEYCDTYYLTQTPSILVFLNTFIYSFAYKKFDSIELRKYQRPIHTVRFDKCVNIQSRS